MPTVPAMAHEVFIGESVPITTGTVPQEILNPVTLSNTPTHPPVPDVETVPVPPADLFASGLSSVQTCMNLSLNGRTAQQGISTTNYSGVAIYNGSSISNYKFS